MLNESYQLFALKLIRGIAQLIIVTLLPQDILVLGVLFYANTVLFSILSVSVFDSMFFTFDILIPFTMYSTFPSGFLVSSSTLVTTYPSFFIIFNVLSISEYRSFACSLFVIITQASLLIFYTLIFYLRQCFCIQLVSPCMVFFRYGFYIFFAVYYILQLIQGKISIRKLHGGIINQDKEDFIVKCKIEDEQL